MRLFIGIQFKKEINDSIGTIINQLKANKVKGNYTRYENLHITLLFIGETKELEAIIKAIQEVIVKWRRGTLCLSFDGFDSFKRREGELLYIKVKGDENLEYLHQVILNRLKKEGLSLDEKELKPHITLARRLVFDKKKGNREELLARLSNSLITSPIEINSISLLKSERIDGLLTYTPIKTYNL